jgi:hypothetical protein
VGRIVDTLLLFVLVAVVALRPLVGETYDSAGSSLTAALGGIADPSPLRTLMFDTAIVACAVVCFAVRMRRGVAYRRTGIEWGLALIALAAVVSSVFAGNKRLAINASIDWLCGAVLAITLIQLLGEGLWRRILLAAVVSSACVVAVQCLEDHFRGFDDTLAHYESIKEEFWARQGVAPDSDKVALFEGRLKAREASGPFPHSSIAGSYLSLCALAALGAAAALLRTARRTGDGIDWLTSVAALALTALVLAGMLTTKSLGALLATAAAAVVWFAAFLFRRQVQARRKQMWALGWTAVVLVLGAAVGHGLYHKQLPGVSLTFRWQYWTASARMIEDHWLTGVGRENFGRRYLQYKSIRSPEEVSNPHDLFVQAAAEWGMIGLVGLAVMLVGGSIAVTQCRAREEDRKTTTRKGTTRFPGGWIAALTMVVVVGRVLLLGSSDAYFMYYVGVITAMSWLAAFAVFGRRAGHTAGEVGVGPRSLANGAAAGLFAFLVHDLINFALFVPGTCTTFFALFALCVAAREPEKALTVPAPGRTVRPPLVTSSVLFLVIASTALGPAVLRAYWEGVARTKLGVIGEGPLGDQDSALFYQEAAESDPLDATPLVELAQWAMQRATPRPGRRQEALRLAIESLERAIERDPFQLGLRRMRVTASGLLAESTGAREDHEAAVGAARDALHIYPQNPEGLILLGDCLAAAGQASRSTAELEEAKRRYRQAIELDDLRLEWETLHRLGARERAGIEEKIRHVERILSRG